MKRKGKGENMEERGERCELKKKKGEGGSMMIVNNTHLQNPLTPRKGWPLGADWALV